jgi:hypothetical protein
MSNIVIFVVNYEFVRGFKLRMVLIIYVLIFVGKIQNAQEQNFRNNYRHGYGQYPTRSPFNPRNGYHTTRPNGIISEEKLEGVSCSTCLLK